MPATRSRADERAVAEQHELMQSFDERSGRHVTGLARTPDGGQRVAVPDRHLDDPGKRADRRSDDERYHCAPWDVKESEPKDDRDAAEDQGIEGPEQRHQAKEHRHQQTSVPWLGSVDVTRQETDGRDPHERHPQIGHDLGTVEEGQP